MTPDKPQLDATLNVAYSYLWRMYFFPFAEGIFDIIVVMYHVWQKVGNLAEATVQGIDKAMRISSRLVPWPSCWAKMAATWQAMSERNSRRVARMLMVLLLLIVTAACLFTQHVHPFDTGVTIACKENPALRGKVPACVGT